MSKPYPFELTFQEDGTVVVYGRLTARDGSGSATGVSGEGKWIQQADLSTLTWKAFTSSDGGTTWSEVTSASLTVSDVVINTPVTTNVDWTRDTVGYNFRHTIASTVFTTGGVLGRVEYKATTTGGAVIWGVGQGPVRKVETS